MAKVSALTLKPRLPNPWLPVALRSQLRAESMQDVLVMTASAYTRPADYAIERLAKSILMGPSGDQTMTQLRGGGPSAPTAGLSIVVPLYNEAASLPHLHARLTDIARKLAAGRSLACEVVYVDDGSADGTLSIARALPATGIDIQVISLSRNFGKEAALLA